MFLRKILHTFAGYFFLLFATIIVWLPISILGLFRSRKAYRIIDKIVRAWCRGFLLACGIKYNVEGLENINKNETYVIMTNHRSHFDGPILISCLGIDITIIIKKSLIYYPFWGWAAYLAGFIPIKRESPEHAHKKINEYGKKIIKNRSILFFPEGTRSKSDEMLPFKKGGVIFAISTGLPILPVSISGTRFLLPKGRLIPNAGFAKVSVHKPISTEGLTYNDRDKILSLVENKIKEGFVGGKL